LHNKPQSCGASVASAAGLFTSTKNLDMEKQTDGWDRLLTSFCMFFSWTFAGKYKNRASGCLYVKITLFITFP
jgi:hypothetical protein